MTLEHIASAQEHIIDLTARILTVTVTVTETLATAMTMTKTQKNFEDKKKIMIKALARAKKATK